MSRRVPKCASCGSDCFCLGYKVEIPKKSDARAWRALRLESRKRYLMEADRQAVRDVREKHAAERRVAHLHSRGPNKERRKIIEELQRQMNFVT
jgi:hypothetical protein